MVCGPLTEEEIAGIVDRVFPGVRLVQSEYRPGNRIADRYALQLEHLTELSLQVYRQGTPGRVPDQEVRLLRLLTSETGVPVPRVLLVDENGPTGERPRWVLLSHVPGQPLAQVRKNLDSWDLESVGYDAGRYLAHIHQIRLDAFGTLFSDGTDNEMQEKAHVLATVDLCIEECLSNHLLEKADAHVLRDRLADTHLLTRRQPCLLHGDFWSANLIVERGATGHHVTGIQGFSYAQGGSPEQDIATLFVVDLDDDKAAQRQFLDGYAESGELTASFWDRLRLYKAVSGLCHLARLGPQCTPEQQRQYARFVTSYLDSR